MSEAGALFLRHMGRIISKSEYSGDCRDLKCDNRRKEAGLVWTVRLPRSFSRLVSSRQQMLNQHENKYFNPFQKGLAAPGAGRQMEITLVFAVNKTTFGNVL